MDESMQFFTNSVFGHNIYTGVRTRVIVIHQGRLLLLEPVKPGDGWRLPGGGLEPDESLAECGEREVLEETGIQVKVRSVAFLREFVVPKYCPIPEKDDRIGYALEVYQYAAPLNDQTEPRKEGPNGQLPHWIPVDQVSSLPLWPKELKTLADFLCAGHSPRGVPCFVSRLESPDTPGPQAIDFA